MTFDYRFRRGGAQPDRVPTPGDTGLRRPMIVRKPKAQDDMAACRGEKRRNEARHPAPEPLLEPGVRWTRQRKHAVIQAIDRGQIAADEACRRYGLSTDELAEWRSASATGGRPPVVWRRRPQTVTSGIRTFGAVEIDLDAGTVHIDGTVLPLSPSEWRVLQVFAEADGAVVTSAMVMGALYSGLDKVATPKIAYVLVWRLRRKLGDEARRLVAVWGRGFQLVPD